MKNHRLLLCAIVCLPQIESRPYVGAVAGKKYRLSFVRPNNAADIPARILARTGTALGTGLALLTVGRKVEDIGTCRQAVKAWQKALVAAVLKP